MTKMPLLLVALIVAVLLGGQYLPLQLQSGLYALSLSIKSLISLVLPIIIFGLLFRAAALMARGAPLIIGLILSTVGLSTFIAVFLARFVGLLAYDLGGTITAPSSAQILSPLWTFEFPSLFGNEKALILALALGFIGAFFKPLETLKVSEILENIVNKILSGIVLVIPFFVTGFLVKLRYEGAITTVFRNYSVVWTLIVVAQFGYLFLIFLAMAGGSFKKCFKNLKHFIPSMISGFSTMSSAATLPLLLKGVMPTLSNKTLTKIVLPSLVNIHMVGECFTSITLAYAVAKSYGVPTPSFIAYIWFSIDFFLARFFVAAIPGGAILVIYHLLRKYFFFTEDMLAMITAVYILFDPFLTMANILGDAALAQIIDGIATKVPWISRNLSSSLTKLAHNVDKPD